MTRKIALPLFAAMMLMACGSGAATAQSFGNTDPAFANTTDPNSAPTMGRRRLRAEAYPAYRRDEVYARGTRHHRRYVQREPAATPDPALQSQRDTARFMRDAISPYSTTATRP